MTARTDQALAESEGIIGQAQPVSCEPPISRSGQAVFCKRRLLMEGNWLWSGPCASWSVRCQSLDRALEANLLSITVIFHHMRLLSPMLLYKGLILYIVNRDSAPEAVSL